MNNNKYAKAYVEVLEILNYLPKEEYIKIPIEKIEFYKKNMDKNYVFSFDPQIDLDEQNISIEASAIILAIFKDFFSTEKQKQQLEELIILKQKMLEEEKRAKYNPDDLFKKHNNNIENLEISKSETNTGNALVEYKESFFSKLKNFIFKMLHINI